MCCLKNTTDKIQFSLKKEWGTYLKHFKNKIYVWKSQYKFKAVKTAVNHRYISDQISKGYILTFRLYIYKAPL